MDIKLLGFSPDRFQSVLSSILSSAGKETVSGYFCGDNFVSDGDLPEDVQEIIANYFAPETLECWLEYIVKPQRFKLMNAFEWRYVRYYREVRKGVTTTDTIETLDAYMDAVHFLPDALIVVVEDIVWPAIP